MTRWKEMGQHTSCSSAGELKDIHVEVAQKRLLESTDEVEALEVIREIVSNLLGSEEIALFKVGRQDAILRLFWSFGVEAERHSTLDAKQSPELQRVIEGEPYFEGAFDGEQNGSPIAGFTTFVPIRLASQTVAVLAIRRLLPQKTRLDESDLQLLRLLSIHAGEALFRKRSALVLEGQKNHGLKRHKI